ncbi:MAG TPA: oxidoreductase [Casimicrobiaceae bacterium]|nr:oxidoreductase [Casimicrobiaceae bacterium]
MASQLDDTAVWLITGCSAGFGRALAERVLAHGHRCVATTRAVASIEPLVAPFPERGLAVALDVTDAAQRDHAVAAAEARFGRIDVLVNNAGWGYNAAVEEGEDEVVRAMFDANFFALAALIRRVLPGMRERGRGHIVNFSSIGGLIGNPGSGYYCATKFAVEGLSQALAKEAGPLGIRVTLVEPGPFRTDFQGRSMTLPKAINEAYAQTSGARRSELRQSSGKQPGDPYRAADAVIAAVEAENPPLQLLLGKVALDRARENLESRRRSIDEWEAVTLSADFPS